MPSEDIKRPDEVWPPTEEELAETEVYPVQQDKWPHRPMDMTDEDIHGEFYH